MGLLEDRLDRSTIVMLGYGICGSITVCLVFASSHWEIVAAFKAYGLF